MAKRKKINPRVLLVVGVLGVILLGAIVAYVIQSLPKDPTVELQAAEAEAAKDKPDWKEVFKRMGRARANTKDPKALANLWFQDAELHFDCLQREPSLTQLQREEHQQAAWSALAQAVRQDNQHLPARKKYCETYWRPRAFSNPDSSKVWQDYIAELGGILTVDPKDAESYFMRAVAYMRLAQTDPQYQTHAIEDFRKAAELDKTNVEYWNALAQYYFSIGQASEAEQVLKEAIQGNPNKALLHVTYARFLRQQKRTEEAEKEIQEAIRCEPSSPLGYLDQATSFMMKKQLDQAETALNQAQKIAPTDVQVYAEYLLLCRMKNDRKTADKVLREGLAALDKEDAQAKSDDKVGALRRGQIRATLNYMLADILLDIYATTSDEKEKEKYLGEIKERYQILSTLSTSQMQKDHIAGRIAYFEKKWAEAREKLENVVDRDPTSRVALMLLNVYNQLGIPGQTEKLAERVLDQGRLSPEGQLLFMLELAQLQLNTGEYDKAQKLVDQAAKINPKDENVIRIQQALDAYHGKSTALDNQQRGSQVTRAMLFRRVQEMLLNDQEPQAEALLEKMLTQNPADLQILSRLVSLLVENQKRERALEWVAKAQEKEPQNEDIKRLEAVLKETSSEKRYEVEMGFVDSGKTEDQMTKVLQKWSIAARYGKTDDAKKYLEEAEKIDPNNNVVINIRFRDALIGQEWTKAEELISRIQEDETGMVRDMQRARLAMARGQAEMTKKETAQGTEHFNQALTYLQAIEQKAPYLPVPRLLMAECYKQMGKPDEAKKQYKACYDNDPQNLQAITGLAQLAQSQGRTEETAQWIQEAYKLPAGKSDPYVQEQYMQILEANPQNLRDVVQRRERVLKRTPEDLGNAFRLAVLYERSGQMNRAQEMIEYIYNRTPRKTEIAPMLADLYLRMNRPTKADEMFSELLKNAKSDEEKVASRIAYANYLTKTDETAAIRMYEKAIEEEGDKGTAGLLAMSNFRAAQAQQLASRGNPEESKTRWNESIDLMKKVIERNPSDKATRLSLLQRYIDSGQYDNAIEGFQQLIQENPNDTEARLGLGLTYLQNDQLDDAEQQFNEVVRINPELSQAYILRSRVYQSRMELSKAAADINTSANLTGSLQQKLDLAHVYEAMGDPQQAAQTYDSILAENPEEFNAYRDLMNLFLQQKRWSALDALARKGMQVMPQRPEFAMSLASAALEQGNTNGQLYWLGRASETAPDNPSVLWQYWKALLKKGDYTQLQRETQKYSTRPAQGFGIQAAQAAAQAKQNPNAPQPFQALMAMLHGARNPYEVNFVDQLLQEAYGAMKVVAMSPEIINARPQDVDVLMFLGDMCSEAKKYPEAEKNYKESLALCKIAAQKIPVYIRLAQLYSRVSDFAKVEQQYRNILQDNPNSIIALNNLAYTYVEHLNRPEEGLKLIQRAMKITPGDPNLIDTYAWALAKLGRFDEARDMFEKIIGTANAANSADRLYHMGFVLENTGASSDAVKYYRQALEVAGAQEDAKLQETIQAALARVENK